MAVRVLALGRVRSRCSGALRRLGLGAVGVVVVLMWCFCSVLGMGEDERGAHLVETVLDLC